MKQLTGLFTVQKDGITRFKQLLNEYHDWCVELEGCTSIACYQDLKVEHIFSLVSEWKNREVLLEHLTDKRFTPFFEALKLLEVPPIIRFSLILYEDGFAAIKAQKLRMGYL